MVPVPLDVVWRGLLVGLFIDLELVLLEFALAAARSGLVRRGVLLGLVLDLVLIIRSLSPISSRSNCVWVAGQDIFRRPLSLPRPLCEVRKISSRLRLVVLRV